MKPLLCLILAGAFTKNTPLRSCRPSAQADQTGGRELCKVSWADRVHVRRGTGRTSPVSEQRMGTDTSKADYSCM